jgi:hypothetical protein
VPLLYLLEEFLIPESGTDGFSDAIIELEPVAPLFLL